MSITSDIEEKLGVKIEDLNALEKETYFKMLESVKEKQLTPEKLHEYLVSMRDAVERELINEPEFIRIFLFRIENRNQILLKARLKNYMLLIDFLVAPKRAKETLESMMSNIPEKK